MGGAGSYYLALAFRNRTTRTCVTGGYSGVTLLGTDRRSLGIARRAGDRPTTLVLAPGQSVYETVQYGATAADESACPAVKSVRVYVPNSRQAVIVALPHGTVDCGRSIFVYRMARTLRESVG